MNSSRYLHIPVILLFILTNNINAQFAPPAGIVGTTAIRADSSIFIDWANGGEVIRGYADISDPGLGFASFGTEESAFGKADNLIVSLGDGGVATLTFIMAIVDGEGWDFAVFENSFSDTFLELAFVEVSSDGVNFFRFNSTSLTQDTNQVMPFGELDAREINNLAGKYRGMFGVPFDLSELSNITELDRYNITHVRIIDVVGSISSDYSTTDGQGNIINDPWPTPFESSGFDLDAIGVINNISNSSINTQIFENEKLVYPNPAKTAISFNTDIINSNILISNMSGKAVMKINNCKSQVIDISNLAVGFYNVRVVINDSVITCKLFKVD